MATWDWCFYFQSVHFHGEVILQEKEANDGEQVDQDESQDRGQDDGAAIASDAFDDVQQGLFSVHQIKELQRQKLKNSLQTNNIFK